MIAAYVHGESPIPLKSHAIGAALDRAASAHGEREAVVSAFQELRYTYREFKAETDCVARALMALAVRQGDRVGIWSSNCAEWLLVQYAVAKVGGVLVHLNPGYNPGELAAAVEHAGVKVLFTAVRFFAANCLSIASALATGSPLHGRERNVQLPALRCAVSLTDDSLPGVLGWADFRARAASVPIEALRARETDVDCEAPASIMYTSRTPGALKGATLTHQSLVNGGFFVGERLRYGPGDRICLPVPLFDPLGNVLGAMAAVMHGGTIVLPSEIFDARASLAAIAKERCTAFYGVPLMFTMMLTHPAFTTARVVSLRTGVIAGGPCPVELMREVVTRMHMPEVTICYGTIEAGTLCQSWPDVPIERRPGTAGAVHPHVECKIVDPSTGRVMHRGEPGELWARGYGVMSGYWNDRASTEQILRPDGWLRTGDLSRHARRRSDP